MGEHKTASSGKPSPVKVTESELKQLKYIVQQTRLRASTLHKPVPEYVLTTKGCGKFESKTTTKALTADLDKYFKHQFGNAKNHVQFKATAWRHLGVLSLRDQCISRKMQQALVKHMVHTLGMGDKGYDDFKQTAMRY